MSFPSVISTPKEPDRFLCYDSSAVLSFGRNKTKGFLWVGVGVWVCVCVAETVDVFMVVSIFSLIPAKNHSTDFFLIVAKYT